jgi:RsiW-degrading membrane proteinase PrsW (M82 family)
MRPRTVRLWAPVGIICLVSAVIAITVWLWPTKKAVTPQEQAERIARTLGAGEGHRAYWKLLQQNPEDVRIWLRFIDAYAHVKGDERDEDEVPGGDAIKPVAADAEVRQLLARVKKPEVRTLATFWYESQVAHSKPDVTAVRKLADAPHPVKLANFVLARLALQNEDKEWPEAARRFEREALAFPKTGDQLLRNALFIWIDHDAWGEVRKRAHDPRYAPVRDAAFHMELAEHDHDWLQVLLWIWPSTYVHTQAWPLALAILAAVLWFAISTRLGRIHDHVNGRVALYTGAFLLGVISIYPTLLLVSFEETLLGFKELGQPLPDAIYFIFGVGLREELCKLLLFLPLLPMLRRRGSRIEAMTCGALVGLGFAAEENVAYFHRLAASGALSRFLTANFLHMSLTALVALSVFDAVRGRSTNRDTVNIIFPLAVIIHGAYDLFLTTGPALLAMFFFVVVSRQFLRQLLVASSKMEEEGALRLLMMSMALLTGASYIYATTLVGPLHALGLIAVGFVGVAIVVYMFVTELT